MNKYKIIKIIKKVFIVLLSILIVFITNGFIEKAVVNRDLKEFKARGIYTFSEGGNNFYKVIKKYDYEDTKQVYNPLDKYQYIGTTGDIILTSRNPMRYSRSWLVENVCGFFSKNFFVGHSSLIVSDDGAIMAEITAHEIVDGENVDENSGVRIVINDWINADDGSEYILGLRVKNASSEDIEEVVDYVYDNLGKKYNYSFLFFRKNRYYCTDLVSRAYKAAGININYDYLVTTGNDMIVSSNTYLVFCREKVVNNGNTEYNIYYLCEE